MFSLTRAKYMEALESVEAMQTAMETEMENLGISCGVLSNNWFGKQADNNFSMMNTSLSRGNHAKAYAYTKGMAQVMGDYLPEIEKMMAKREQIGKQLHQDEYYEPDLSTFSEEKLIINYEYIDDVKADAQGAVSYAEKAVEILEEMIETVEKAASDYVDLSKVKELLEEGKKEIKRIENYRDEFADFGNKMSDLEYNMSYDLAVIMREQGEQLKIHNFSIIPELALEERGKQMEGTSSDTEIVQEQVVKESPIITKPYVILPLLGLFSPITVLPYITSGIGFGNKISVLDDSRTPLTNKTGDWVGYEFSEDNPGVTAWIGKAGAKAQNEWGYAGVNAYLGKAEGEVKTDFAFMKKKKEKEYREGKWEEKERMYFINAEAGAGGSISAAAIDGEVGLGSDMLGIEGKAEGTAGNAKAEVKGAFSISEDGVTAKVQGEALVSAVEGEASGTINILGLEVTGKVGGYAGAVGVEGKLGVEDNKFVMRAGAAALLGVSGEVEVGFNDEGWDNFVDFIVFWD